MPCARSRTWRDGLPDVGLHLLEQPGDGREVVRLVAAVAEQLPGQAEVHGQRGEVLLRAVVDVALDPAALGVGGRHQPGPGRPQLVVGAPEVVQRRLQRGVQRPVVQHDAENAIATVGLAITLLTLVAAFLVYRRFAGRPGSHVARHHGGLNAR